MCPSITQGVECGGWGDVTSEETEVPIEGPRLKVTEKMEEFAAWDTLIFI